ncbi:SCP2 sterol-binding domain-containing protein [Haladaptatus sp. GCM10025707]|uniref:SCP2 sterol-binding domain-containing protein n=1 Tax=unclassified Haladaptatus TaxID=2622732 RepID=UPI0023E7D9DB|nr:MULTISPECIES: SCP2 sterol-binding domain-containing protein [unclassified Haladaptatus]
MATDHTGPLIFPSQPWFDRYREVINGDEKHAKLADGYGTDFNGDYIFVMTDMPVDEMNEAEMPDFLREELEEFVHETPDDGHVGCAYLGLEDGRCTGARLVESPDAVDHGFVLTATIDDWKDLIDGQVDIISGMMSGRFALDGDMQKTLQYSAAAQRLTELAASVDAQFADEIYTN